MSRRRVLMLLALAALWGSSFMFIKICVRELAPTTLVCLRLGIGSLVLAPFALARLGGRRFVRETRSALAPLVIVGLFVGFAGVAFLVGAQPSGDIVAALAVTFSALCYAVAALYSARMLAGVPPLVTAVVALAAAALSLLPF